MSGFVTVVTRTIPTRVGSTMGLEVSGFLHADHPRAGGEHVVGSRCLRDDGGPSPRGWGALSKVSAARLSERTIPTRVGSTFR